jgi:SAM-dependent methyltransferase
MQNVCSACSKKITFNDFGGRNSVLCPNCGSLERHRLSVLAIKSRNIDIDSNKIKILHVSPDRCIFNYLSGLKCDYYPVDINPDYPNIRHVADVTRLPYPDDYFDVILCNHVLDEVKSDRKALSEVKRTMKNDGILIISSYVNPALSVTKENLPSNNVDDRKKNYGSDKRFRIYGKDLIIRLLETNLNPELYSLNAEESQIYGTINESVYVCKK